MPGPCFYFDVGSPYAYLAAERVEALLGEPPLWQPILLGGLFKLTGRSSWALGEHRRRQAGMAEIERRAADYGLPALRWPDPWPGDYLTAMRAATYARAVGRGPAFARRAFRDAFQDGRDLGITANVLAAGERSGLDRRELAAALEDPQIKRPLREATEAAFELGVIGVPTLSIGDELFWGDDRLGDAAARLRGAMPAP